jgi:5-methylcytosine-specific restriction endonuclease McrA
MTYAIECASGESNVDDFKSASPVQVELSRKETSLLGYYDRVGKISAKGILTYTPKFKKWLAGQQDGRCGYCGDVEPDGQIDHIIPKSKGGIHTLPNLIYVCHSCNASKCNRDLNSLRELLRVRGSKVYGIIKPCAAFKLVELGIDIGLPEPSEFFFESKDWAHVAGGAI